MRQHIRARSFLSRGGGSWKDPARIGQYAALCVLYFAGLLAFQRFTGLLDPLSPPPSRASPGIVHTAEDARSFLRAFDDSGGGGGGGIFKSQRSHLFRHLLQSSEDGAADKPEEPAKEGDEPAKAAAGEGGGGGDATPAPPSASTPATPETTTQA